MKPDTLKLALLLISSFLAGHVVGAMQGVAIFLFDPEDFASVLPVSRGSIDLIEWSMWVATVPFFVALFAFVPGLNMARKAYGDRFGTSYYGLFLAGWVLAIGPFFYVFRTLPD